MTDQRLTRIRERSQRVLEIRGQGPDMDLYGDQLEEDVRLLLAETDRLRRARTGTDDAMIRQLLADAWDSGFFGAGMSVVQIGLHVNQRLSDVDRLFTDYVTTLVTERDQALIQLAQALRTIAELRKANRRRSLDSDPLASKKSAGSP